MLSAVSGMHCGSWNISAMEMREATTVLKTQENQAS